MKLDFNTYLQLKTKTQKAEFALRVLDEKHHKTVSFPKIAETSIDILVYAHFGKKYDMERNYKPIYKDERKF